MNNKLLSSTVDVLTRPVTKASAIMEVTILRLAKTGFIDKIHVGTKKNSYTQVAPVDYMEIIWFHLQKMHKNHIQIKLVVETDNIYTGFSRNEKKSRVLIFTGNNF